MVSLVYILGAVVAAVCAALLLRRYAEVRHRLLLWSGLCFVFLTISNSLVFVDLVLLPVDVSLYLPRLITAALAMSLLLYGLIWDGD